MVRSFVKRLLIASTVRLSSYSHHLSHQLQPHKRRWFALSIAFCIIIAAITPRISYSQTTSRDIQGHWAQPCIEKLIRQDIITSYEDRSFRPSLPVKRAEFARMLDKAFPNAPKVRNAVQFADIPSNYWAAGAIRRTYQAGFLSGYLSEILNPLKKISREQLLVALVSGLKYSPTQPVDETLNAVFTDAQAISNYARQAIAAATEKQLVVNYPEVSTLNPNLLATRGEVSASLCQALGYFGLVPEEYIAVIETPTLPTTPSTTSPTTSLLKTSLSTSTAEIRGVWLTNIDSDVLFSRDRLTTAMQRLRDLNFNTIYPTVWNGGYTLYPSRVAQRTFGRSIGPEPGLQGRDMLKEIVELGHKNGLTVIPWFEFGFMAPANSELAKRHPDWLTQRRDGTKVWKEGIEDRVWLNPFHPEVQQFIINLITEIVSNYDVDGIQFDDHFSLPIEFGYDNFTVGLYKKELPGFSPDDNPSETYWVRWRADKLNDFMAKLFRAIKASKSNCIVSVSPNPLHFSLPAHLQDWFTWERRGLVEEIVLQVYRDDLKRFITELERAEVQLAQTHIPVAVGIMTGLKNNSTPIEQIQTQVQAVRDRGLTGVSFFFYESLWNWAKETPAERENGLKSLFSVPVSRPNILQGGQPPSSNEGLI